MEKMCVSEFAAGDYLTREEQLELLRTYRRNGVRRWHSSNAGTKVCGKTKNTLLFFSYKTCVCGITHTQQGKTSVLLMPYVYAHEGFINSRTTNRHLHKFLLENSINTSMAQLHEFYENIAYGLRVPPIRDVYGNEIDVQFSPHGIYIEDYGIDDDDLCINVPRVVLTADGNDCVGVYD